MVRFLVVLVLALVLVGAAIAWVSQAADREAPILQETATPTPPETRPRAEPSTPTIAPTPERQGTDTEPQAQPDPQALLQTILDTPIPARDLYELARRLKDIDAARISCTEAPELQAGAMKELWISDQPNNTYFQVEVRLSLLSETHYHWVQEGLQVDSDALQNAARDFEDTILPTLHRTFGREWSPGIDCDPRIHIVNARIPALGGYFSGADEFPDEVNPFSNEWEAIYINADALTPGQEAYRCVLAHEFQHMIHWNVDPNEDTWVNEGLSELASQLVGCPPSGALTSFTRQPDTQLNTWAEEPQHTFPHYGAAYIFLSYLHQRFGDETLKRLVAEPEDGIAGIKRALAGQIDFETLFQDWLAAMLVDANEGTLAIAAADPRPMTDQLDPPDAATEVGQFAADYFEVEKRARLSFEGQREVRLLPTAPHSGRALWWSNRADDADTRLTRRVDLSGTDSATLKLWLWYHIEEHFDYAYLEVSTDGGQTWEIQRGRHTTAENPNGNSFGQAWTGRSQGWIEEEVDLSRYAGQEILLRFEYVTDDALNTPGLALDDLSIPEIGYQDDAETAEGWQAEGFVHASEWLPQRWSVQVIHNGEFVAREGRAKLDLDLPEGGVVIVAGLTPVTTEPARYRFTLATP